MHYGHSVKYDLPGLDHMPTTKADRWRQPFPNHKPEIGERAVPQIEKTKQKTSLAALSRRRTDVCQENNRFPQTVCKLKMLLWEDSRKRILHLLRYLSKDGMTIITPAQWGAVDGSQILDDRLSSKDNDSPLSSALL